ncbi:TIGR01741 family protein, partial [Staphylococcus aureus]|uniref:TIGR01741 family protein n=1 Tax=Staphylococcus aureus TaxID=1280 RepID=UPI001C1FC3C0
VTDQAGEVIFNYTKPGSDELNYYSDIPKDCNVSKDIFKNSWFKVYRLFKKLRNAFKEEGLEPWTSCEFDFTREGNLKVSFDYIDWIKLGFGPSGKENYYMYKKFGVIPEMEYEMEEIKEIEQYIKEQDEAEL